MKICRKVMAAVLIVMLLVSSLGGRAYAAPESFSPSQQAEEMEAVLEAMPGLEEMQSARGSEYTVAKYGSSEAARAAFDAYISDCFLKIQNARQKYEALPEEAKALISKELVEKLEEGLDTVFHQVFSQIKEGHGSYQFQVIFPKNRSYELGTHFNDGGHPMTVIMVDTDQVNGSWAPSAPYSFGNSEYEVLYCCEIKQPVIDGVLYKRINLEDADYYEAQDAAHIRAIVMNSYPYLSLEQMKENLKEANVPYAEQLTRGDVISAVQFAIWHYSNRNYASVEGMSEYGQTIDINSVSYAKAFHDYSNELWDWWKVGRNGSVVDENARKRVNALVEYLIGLEEVPAEEEKIVISSLQVVSAEPIQAKDGFYNAAIKVVLNGSIQDGDQAELLVTSEDQAGVVTDIVKKPLEKGLCEYNLIVQAKVGETIRVTVEGTQLLQEGVYLYLPEGGKDISQVLVGVAAGKTQIAAEAVVSLDLPEEEPETVDLVLQKADENGAALPRATFELYRVSGEHKLFIGSYEVDSNGRLTVEDLLAGSYELIETVAPEGYLKLEQSIGFSISTGETKEIGLEYLNEAVYLEEEEGRQILTVLNFTEDDVLGDKESPKTGDPGLYMTLILMVAALAVGVTAFRGIQKAEHRH